MSVLITGAAGFIGYHVSQVLLGRGETVIGVDDLNNYYDVNLKLARLEQLKKHKGFRFHKLDIADHETLLATAKTEDGRQPITGAIHLACQAGVRYSLENPYAYIHSNVLGHTAVLEMCRRLPKLAHLVYASSSSVYGSNTKMPFSVDDRVDTQVSLYGATKKADEVISHAYSHLFRIPQTGLRFFTVYGPWGRPDMALFMFTKAILAGKPIQVFNNGDMARDFTFIDDIVRGVIATFDGPPADKGAAGQGPPPCRVYNIGNHRSEPLLRLIEILENTLGRKAIKEMLPMQPGDVKASFADIDAIRRDFGFEPTTPIDVGIPKFVAWYREFYRA
jgi:UDP-glucuronate 4-epimerase